jgi:hypothetical protein
MRLMGDPRVEPRFRLREDLNLIDWSLCRPMEELQLKVPLWCWRMGLQAGPWRWLMEDLLKCA